jgi:MFS transporter, DHA3 family, macrolide efflux protein
LKNKQAIILLFMANSVSGIAQGITMLAIPWYLTNTANQYSLFGILYAGITGFSVFWMLYSGTLIDRFDRKRIFQWINVSGAIVFLSLSAYGFFVAPLSVGLASLAFACTFFIYNIHFPNLYAFAQEITEGKHYGRIISWLEIQHQLTSAAAGAIGAFLLAGIHLKDYEFMGFTLNFHMQAWSLKQVFLFDGSTYALALILIGFIQYIPIFQKKIETGSIRERLLSGFTYLKKHSMLFVFGTVSYALFITVLVAHFFIIPKYIDNHIHGAINTYSVLELFFAGGAVFAGIFIRKIFQFTNVTKSIIILGILGSLFYFIGLFNQSTIVFFMLGLILGLSNAGTRILRATYIFQLVPNHIIGRVISIFNLYHIFFRLGFILLFSLPFFVVGNNILYSILLMGLFILLSMGVLMLFYRKINREG